MVIAVAGGVLFTIFRWSTAQLGRVLRVLVIAPLAFAVAFVGFSPASDVVFGGGASSAGAAAPRPSRLVMVVFDELPLATLLDGQGAIDAALFPNFAALARTSSWFRNTTTMMVSRRLHICGGRCASSPLPTLS